MFFLTFPKVTKTVLISQLQGTLPHSQRTGKKTLAYYETCTYRVDPLSFIASMNNKTVEF